MNADAAPEVRQAGPARDALANAVLTSRVRLAGARTRPSLPPATWADLVLWGVAEIELGGAYVRGLAAFSAFDFPVTPLPRGTVAGQLSAKAVCHGQSFVSAGVTRVAHALYNYPRHPRLTGPPGSDRESTRASFGRVSSSPAVAPFWDADTGTARSPWVCWRPRTTPVVPAASAPIYKLYVSPTGEAFEHALLGTLATLVDGDAFLVKATCPPGRALRPDKVIAYFADRSAVFRAADSLRPHLAGMKAVGVPFTAPLSHDGLLAWGADPPVASLGGRGRRRESWRQWVVDRLAHLLVVGSATGPGSVDPGQFAISCLASFGLDVVTWNPTPNLWD